MPHKQGQQPPVVGLTQIVSLLNLSVDELSAATLRRVWGSPGYDEQHMTVEDLFSALQPNMQAIVRSLGRADGLEPHALESAARIGESRALQGVPVDAVMQSWTTAERVVLDHLLAHAEALAPAELRAAVSRLGDVIGGLSQHSVDAYRRTQEEVTTHYDRLTTDLVARLTGEAPTDADEVRRRARTIGVDPALPYVALAIAVQSKNAAAHLKAQRHLLGTVAARFPGRVLIGSLDEYPLILLPAPQGSAPVAAAVSAALGRPGCPDSMLVAVSDGAAPLPSVGSLCHDARDALETGMRLGWQRRVVRCSAVLPEMMLIRNPEVAEMLQRRIAPLLARPELLETLQAYLRSGLSARETARQLFVHPNTVPYRLRLIERELGCTLSDVEQLTDVVLALRYRQMGLGSG